MAAAGRQAARFAYVKATAGCLARGEKARGARIGAPARAGRAPSYLTTSSPRSSRGVVDEDLLRAGRINFLLQQPVGGPGDALRDDREAFARLEERPLVGVGDAPAPERSAPGSRDCRRHPCAPECCRCARHRRPSRRPSSARGSPSWPCRHPHAWALTIHGFCEPTITFNPPSLPGIAQVPTTCSTSGIGFLLSGPQS